MREVKISASFTKIRGYILLFTFYIISIMSLIILSLQISTQLDLKNTNNLAILHEELHYLENTARQVMQNFDSNQLCVLPNKSEYFNYENILKHGCSVKVAQILLDSKFLQNKSPIYYTITDLGEVNCLRSMHLGKSVSTHHYLLNFMNPNLLHKILQIRYAKNGSEFPCKNSKSRHIIPGVVSWIVKTSN